ncbi:MAG: arginine repressor [Clostridia bacterium]|nr:arginine repressor [Clostridia bacterium]
MKSNRQLAILRIIENQEIPTQEELLTALKKEGFTATQATISRDIKELRLHKVPATVGQKYSVKPDLRSPVTREDKYRNVLTSVLVSAVPAGNIGVIKTLSGTASAAAAALEAENFTEIIGTLAGDDTLLVLFATDRAAGLFCRRVEELYLMEKGYTGETEL